MAGLFSRLRSSPRPPDGKGEDYWGGRTWVGDYTITDGGGGGEITMQVQPGDQNELELQSVLMNNRTVAGLLIRVGIAHRLKALGEGPTDNLTEFLIINGALGAGAAEHWPQYASVTTISDRPSSGGSRRIIAGDMVLWCQWAAPTANNVVRTVVTGRIHGSRPSVLIESAGGSGMSNVAAIDKVFPER